MDTPETLQLFEDDEPLTRSNLNINHFQELNEGGEGRKGFLDLNIGGKNVTFFVKFMPTLEEALAQRQKYLALTSRGIPTFDFYTLARLSNGTIVTLTEDRTQGGKHKVISTVKEISDQRAHYQRMHLIDSNTLDKLVRNTFDIALGASVPDENGKVFSFHKPDHILNPFMIDINSHDVNDVNIFVGDLGKDSMYVDSRRNNTDLIKDNLRSIYLFLFNMLGYFGRIPKDHPAYKYKDFYSEEEWRSIENSEVYFRSSFNLPPKKEK